MKNRIILFGGFLFIFFAPTLALAQTTVSGALPSDTTWTAADSPYIISPLGLTIPAGVTLAIQSGVVVKASQSNTPLTINGTLNVQGTEFFPTYFTSFNDTTVGGDTGFSPFGFSWSGITVNIGATVHLDHAVIRNSNAGISNNGGTSVISNSIFENSTNGISHSSGTTTIAASTFQNNQTGIFSSGTGTVSFIDSLFIDNNTLGHLNLSSGLTFSNSGNTASGTGRKGIFLYGTGDAVSNQTLSGDAIPYVITTFGVTIPAEKTFTVEPGAIIKFEQNNASITVNGTLSVQGTAVNPIYFTSLDDDTVGGDSDGGSNSSFISQWGNITLTPGAAAHFNHSILRRGGVLANNGGTLTVSNSEISGSSSYGIVHSAGTTDTTSTAFSNNSYGLYAGGNGTVSLTNNTFSDERAGAGYFELSNGLIFANTGNSATGTRSGFFLFANGADTVSSQTLSGDTIPYVITVFGVTIPAGKTLTVEPGAIIKFEQNNASLTVNGTLDVAGTRENPVYVTAFADDTLGGDTDGNPSQPQNQWGNITINPASTAHFNHVILKNGGSISNNGGTLDVFNSEISGSSSYGIFHGAGTTTVSQSSIHDNASYGICNNTANILNAENNWWGSPTGPRHASNPTGTGDKVSDNIDFVPWLGYDPTVVLPLALSLPAETEDDGNQDGKGVADKTNFTFEIMYTGATAPGDVALWTNDGTLTAEYPLALSATPANDGDFTNGETYTITRTFPKGRYGYHFEANGGTLRSPETGELSFTTGYSNVAFLPGLEASRLYRPEVLSGTDEDQLWEPTRNQDVEELYLDSETGESLSSNIYTRDVIDSAYGLMNIYSSFIEFMDGLKTDGTIHDWEELPYDWRFDYEKLLTSGKKTGENISYLEATSTPFILQELRRLAEDSDTGKVTIITHSNGGLVAKYLLKKLELENDPLLPNIDKLIMVAAPQIGTPGAIEGLLHGDEQQIGVAISKTDFGMLMDEERSRELGENMQSAYNLLPSQKYFETVQSPVIEFEPNDPITHTFSTLYGETINTPNELRNFLLGDPQSGSPRTEPEPDDEESPNVLKPQFLDRATENHDIMLDGWTPPASMEVVQIAGWGEKTVRGIEYSCGLLTCSSLSTLDRKILNTTDGDGTVVVPSALAVSTSTLNVQRYFVDLGEYNKWGGFRINRNHSDILEVDPLQKFLKSIIEGVRSHNEFIKESKPSVESSTKRLDFTLHSPVALHLYGNEGTHTGRIPNPISGSDFRAYEAHLPNSYYREYGETKYAGSDTFATTTIKLVGEALGSFTFDIDETLGDTLVASTTWKDIPVTASSTLTLDIQTLANTATLQMDVDGDGITDTALLPGDGVTSQELFAILKGIIKTFNLSDEKEGKLLKRIEKIEKELAKEQKNEKQEKRKTDKAFDELVKQIKKFEKKKLFTAEEAGELLEIVAKIEASVVK